MGISFPDRRVVTSSGSATASASARSSDVRDGRRVALDTASITSRTGGVTLRRPRAVTDPDGPSTPTAQHRSPGQDALRGASTLVRMAAPVAPPGAAGPGPGGRHARRAPRHAAPDDTPPGVVGGVVPLAARPRRRRAVEDVAPVVPVPDAPTVRGPWPVAASDALTLAGTTTLLPGPPAAPAPVRPPVPARPGRGPRGLVAPPTV